MRFDDLQSALRRRVEGGKFHDLHQITIDVDHHVEAVADSDAVGFDAGVIVGGAAYRTVVSPVRRAVARAVFTLFVMDVRPAFGRPEDRRPTGTASEGGVCAAFCRSAVADG